MLGTSQKPSSLHPYQSWFPPSLPFLSAGNPLTALPHANPPWLTPSPPPLPAKVHLILLPQTKKKVQWCLPSLVLTAAPGRKRAAPSPFRKITENPNLLPTPELAHREGRWAGHHYNRIPASIPPQRPSTEKETWHTHPTRRPLTPTPTPGFQHHPVIRTLSCAQT